MAHADRTAGRNACRIIWFLALVAYVWLSTPSLGQPLIRITGPRILPVGTEARLKALALNNAAEEARAQGAYFEWFIDGVSLHTGSVFRCRSREPAEYLVEVRLQHKEGTQVRTLSSDASKLVFAGERAAPAAPALAEPATLPQKIPALPQKWVLKEHRATAETNVADRVVNHIHVAGEEIVSRSEYLREGVVEARLRWSALPETLTPGNRLVFALVHRLDVVPISRATLELSATLESIFTVTFGSKRERQSEVVSAVAKGEASSAVKTRQVEWQIPSGIKGDELVIEIASVSPAGTGHRLYVYRLEEVGLEPSAKKPTPVRVFLECANEKPPVGASVILRAKPEGGTPPYVFRWSVDSVVLDADTGTVKVPAARVGSVPVEVSVVDKEGQSVSTSLVLHVWGPTVKLVRLKPSGGTVCAGEPVEFRANLVGLHGSLAPHLCFRWTGEPAVKWALTETTSPTNTAVFFEPGMSTVRVTVAHTRFSHRVEPLSTSDPVSVAVTPVPLVIEMAPDVPYVGDLFTLSAKPSVLLDDVAYEWLRWPNNVQLVGGSTNDPVVKAIFTSGRGASFAVRICSLRFGSVLGEAERLATPKTWALRLRGPVPLGTLPEVWEEGKGLVPLTNAFAVGQKIGFYGELQPARRGVRWVWRSGDSACELLESVDSSASLVCSDTGTWTVTAAVYNEYGVKLAEASRSFEIAVPAQRLMESQRRAEAVALRRKAFALLEAKQWAEAAQAFRQSYELWPTEELQRQIALIERRLQQDEEAAKRDAEIKRQQQEREAQAVRFREEGWRLLEERKYEEALAAFERSLQLKRDEELLAQVEQIRSALHRRRQKQDEAARFRKEAEAFEAAGKWREALESYRASLAAWEDNTVAQKVEELEARIAAEEAAQREAQTLIRDAEELEQAGELEAAVSKYRRALELVNNPDIAQRLGRLEERIKWERHCKEKAAESRRNAELLLQKGSFEEALAAFRESWHWWPDKEVKKQIEQLERRRREQEERKANALRLREEAAVLAARGAWEESLARYRQSAQLWSDERVAKEIETLENRLREQRELEKRWRDLVTEAEALEQAGRWADALALYNESLALRSSTDIAVRVKNLHQHLLEERQRRFEASQLRERAARAATKGELEAALQLYEQSLELEPDAEAQAQVEKLRDVLATKRAASEKARELAHEGAAHEQAGELEIAISKYREALRYAELPDVRQRLSALQTELAKKIQMEQESALARRTQEQLARKLREEGFALQQRGQLAEALARFQASLEILPDAGIAQLVRDLERVLSEEKERAAKAQLLREQARSEILAGRLDSALAKYEESVALAPDPRVEEAIAELRQQIAREQSARKQALELRERGFQKEREGYYEEAAALLRQSLDLQPDPEVRHRLAKVEARLQEQRLAKEKSALVAGATVSPKTEEPPALSPVSPQALATAAPPAVIQTTVVAAIPTAVVERVILDERQRLREEAVELERTGQSEEALQKYKDFLKTYADAVVELHVALLERVLREQKRKEQLSRSLIEQMSKLAGENRFAEAAVLCHVLEQMQTQEVQSALCEDLEERLRAQLAKRDELAGLVAKAGAACVRTNYEEALKWLSEITVADTNQLLAQVFLEHLRDHLRLQADRERQVAELLKQAHEKESAGDVLGALIFYEKSLALAPSTDRLQKAAHMQEQLLSQWQRQATAIRLRDEAAIAAAVGNISEALEKYRQSLVLWPDSRLEERLSQWQQELSAQQAKKVKAEELAAEARRLTEQGLWSEALAKWEASLQHSVNVQTLEGLKRVYAELGRQKARAEFGERLWELGMLQLRAGRWDAGMKLLRESVALMPDGKRQEVVDQLGQFRKDVESRRTSAADHRPTPYAESRVGGDTAEDMLTRSQPVVVESLTASGPSSTARWRGVLLYREAGRWHQWPLLLVTQNGSELSGSWQDRGDGLNRVVWYSVSGRYDAKGGAWYLACLRNEGPISAKATLSGQALAPDVIGGTATILLPDVDGVRAASGLWRLIRLP